MDNNINSLITEADRLIEEIEKIEAENNAAIKSREKLIESIEELKEKNKQNTEAYDIATSAIEILKGISDNTVKAAYRFLEGSINDALQRMFKGTTRQIRIKEFIRDDKYPQLEIELNVGNGVIRSLKADSGHGIAQITSILSILCIIVITGARRILAIDEVLSGLSVENRKIITDILWCFTEIGFQFIIIEHGFVPKGAKVYHIKLNGDIGKIEDSYIATQGIYLNSQEDDNINYKENTETILNVGKQNSKILDI